MLNNDAATGTLIAFSQFKLFLFFILNNIKIKWVACESRHNIKEDKNRIAELNKVFIEKRKSSGFSG